MTSPKQKPNHADQMPTTDALPQLPMEIVPYAKWNGNQVARLLEQTAHEAQTAASPFPQGTANLPYFTASLRGVPFVLCSEPRYAYKPASGKAQFGQEVVQFTIRTVDVANSRFNDPRLATLQGAYLLNQVRSMTLNELTGSVFTIAENRLMDAIPTLRTSDALAGRKESYPYMLKLYEEGVDFAPGDDDTDWIGPNGRNTVATPAPVVTLREVPTENPGIPANPNRQPTAAHISHTPEVRRTVANQSPMFAAQYVQFVAHLREAGLVLADARAFLEMGPDDSFIGRDLAEDERVVMALAFEPGETADLETENEGDEEETPQEQIVKRGRGRPRKNGAQ